MGNMAWAENAVIINDTGASVTYHPKCPKCGVISNVTSGYSCIAGMVSNISSRCPKCGETFTIRLGRN